MMDGFIRDDGGRAAAGFKGSAGDCVCRSIVIASGLPYREVYEALAKGTGTQRKSARTPKRSASARNGISVKRQWFREYMVSIGFEWVPTMQIGSGCKVHLCAEELPSGRLVVSVSGHYTAMIDGVIHDTHDPRRETWINVAGPHHPDGDRDPNEALGETKNSNGVWRPIRRCVYGYWRVVAARSAEIDRRIALVRGL